MGLKGGGIHPRLYALTRLGDKAGYFGLARFRYEAEQDVYRCPEGQLLRFLHTDYTPSAWPTGR